MPVVTVSQLNNYIKRYLDQNHQLSDLWIKGEISNYKKHYSGHIYITLKDENSVLKAVMFKSNASRLNFEPSDGMKVVALGKIGVYEAGGVYQLYIDTMIPDGKGELYASYEQLKLKLDNEGLFLPEHKKTIPQFPEMVGVITSASGAALRDILNVLNRRYPLAGVLVYPVMVQGIGASDSICKGLKYLSDFEKCDVIILGRGGGSIEDLWAFNEEKTIRAIFDCKVPVITGIGHETDFTISDFVSDLRAPTPSAAAELAVPSIDEILTHIEKSLHKCNVYTNAKIQICFEQISKYSSENIYQKIISSVENYSLLAENLCNKSKSFIDKKMLEVDAVIGEYISSLEALNPLSVIKRGYSLAQDVNGNVMDFKTAENGDEFNLVFDGGVAECTLRRVEYED